MNDWIRDTIDALHRLEKLDDGVMGRIEELYDYEEP
jgi:hypothetical protein